MAGLDDGDPVEKLAAWSTWVTLAEAALSAPRQPGVYTARLGELGPIVYVGMAGERAGRSGDRKPKGLRGRLSVYASGKAAVSGLGEVAFDRALADVSWARQRLAELEQDGPRRAKAWAQAALTWADLRVRWAVVEDRAAARRLELAVLAALANVELWNRAR